MTSAAVISRTRVDESYPSKNLLAMELVNTCPKKPGDGRWMSFDRFVTSHIGSMVPIGWPPGDRLVIGPNKDAVEFDIEEVEFGDYECVSPLFDIALVGTVRLEVFEPIAPRTFAILSSYGGRVYAFSTRTKLLYILDDEGIESLLQHGRGMRNVFELYDISPTTPYREATFFEFSCSPVLFDAMRHGITLPRIITFQVAHPRFTCESAHMLEGYFMFGDCHHLNLHQFYPGRLFECLNTAGYHVLGQGYRMAIVVVNRECEVFVLLQNAMLLKVANTIVGFIRDRLLNTAGVRKLVFKSGRAKNHICVGECVSFDCDVKYVLQDDGWFYDKLKTVTADLKDATHPKEITTLVISD
uniref:GP28 n=1 Tax=Caviid herpesvirus 2 str. CIDMTR TaxID=1415526 RepID=U6H6B3_9BETA|nr:GP28 [Caviid herpesvirus 2 str. CIDMTR]